MTARTVTGIFDLVASTAQKYLVVNDFITKLEGLAVPTFRSIVITAAPVSPVEGLTYLCNQSLPGINNTGAGSFIRYTKGSNTNSTNLVAQVFQAVDGFSPSDDCVLHAGIWKLKTDPSVYGLSVTEWPDTLLLKVTAPLNLTSSTGQTYVLNGAAPLAFPQTLPIGVYQVVNGASVTFRKLN